VQSIKLEQLLLRQLTSKAFYYVTMFVLNIVMANLLEASNTGILLFFTSNFSILIMFLSLNIETGIVFYLSKQVLQKNAVILFILLWVLLITGLILFLFYFFDFSFLGFSYINFSISDIIFFSLGLLLFTYSSAVLSVDKIFSPQNIIAGFLNVLLIIIFINYDFFKKSSLVFHLFFLNFFLQGVFLFFYMLIKNKDSLCIKFSFKIKSIFIFSIKALFTNILFGVLTRMDFWFLKYYDVSEKDLGNYLQALKLGQQFLTLPALIATTIYPISITLSKQDIKPFLAKIFFYLRIINTLYLLLYLIILIIGKCFFTTIFGNSFDTMNLIFYYMGPSFILHSAAIMLATFMAGRNKIVFNLISTLVAILLGYLVYLFIIPAYGVFGAALGFTIISIFYVTLLISFCKKITEKLEDINFIVITKKDIGAIKKFIKKGNN
jgi:O-antigen/teichoic acid export membrane protein